MIRKQSGIEHVKYVKLDLILQPSYLSHSTRVHNDVEVDEIRAENATRFTLDPP